MCKARNNDGSQCRLSATLNGYCIHHYRKYEMGYERTVPGLHYNNIPQQPEDNNE